MEKVEWKVEGMDCTNCAITISKYLTKEGLQNVKVNFIGGEVSFERNDQLAGNEKLIKGISQLGYKVITENQVSNQPPKKPLFDNHLQRFLFCLPFTLILMLHMLPWHVHFLMNPWIQLAICSPVYLVGMAFFGKSAFNSLRNGVPNMNVLITLGATAAFVYSLIGTVGQLGMDYIFYETAATIITLVFGGEWIENKTVAKTQEALAKLSGQQKIMANMIAFDDQYKEQIFPIESTQLRVGDLILIKSGEQVPIDCKILWGEVHVNEALLTGESNPVFRQKKTSLIGGTLVTDGTVKAQVTAVGKETVLSQILKLVKEAQTEKPPIQQLADKISAVFVPAVILIAILVFFINYYGLSRDAHQSLFRISMMRSIAVLVISCPCAMGLATPAAIAVGLGRAAKNGILFRNATTLVQFKDIKTIVFDKTGTLTKGNFTIKKYRSGALSEEEFRQIIFSLEKFSNHPIAKAIAQEWKNTPVLFWKSVEEMKGVGIKATDTDNNLYFLGATKPTGEQMEEEHTAWLFKNNEAIGWLDMEDEVRPESKDIIRYFKSRNIKTVLLSGDTIKKSKALASSLGIEMVYAEKKPVEKMLIVEELNRLSPTAMIGDGINDAPALAKATIGISMSDASQLAVQTAQVVLMNNGIQHLPLAMGLGKHTYVTIQQNLFWAFIYNIIAIPVAAMGFLHPGISALAMGFSDVVLAINSIRLNYRKVI